MKQRENCIAPISPYVWLWLEKDKDMGITDTIEATLAVTDYFVENNLIK